MNSGIFKKSQDYRLSHVAWLNRANLIKGTLVLLAVDFLGFALPYLVKITLDRLQGKTLESWVPVSASNLPSFNFILLACGIYILIAMVIAYGRYWWRVFFIWSTFQWFHEMRRSFFQHLQKLNRDFFKSYSVGDLISAMTSDTENMRMNLSIGGLMIVDASINFILFPILLWTLNPKLTLYVVPPLFLFSLAAIFLTKRLSALYEDVQEITGRLSGKAYEFMAGIRVIKAFNREQHFHSDFSRESEALRGQSLKVARYQSLFSPGLEFILALGICFTLFYGGRLVLRGEMSISSLVAFQLYLQNLDWPMMAIGWFIQMHRQSQASQKRVMNFASRENSLLSTTGRTALKSLKHSEAAFEIHHLTFRHEERRQNLFSNLNLSIRSGVWTGITGPVGSGKTTLFEMLSRQRDPTAGSLFFHDEDLRSIPPEEVRKRILYIPQESFMFSRSMRDNLTLGLNNRPSDQSLWELLQDLSFDREILEQRGGLETKLGERGVNLSGGQKQRISLGRAMTRGRDVYLLDDLFSHVDVETESRLVTALRKNLPEKSTVILVSQRIQTLLECDDVGVLVDGKLEFSGSSQQARKDSAYFARLFELQNFERSQLFEVAEDKSKETIR